MLRFCYNIRIIRNMKLTWKAITVQYCNGIIWKTLHHLMCRNKHNCTGEPKSIYNITLVLRLGISLVWAKFGVAPRGTGAEIQNSASKKFCPPTHRIYTPSFIDLSPAVSEPWGFENVDTVRMVGWTFLPVLQVILGETATNN